LLVALPHRLFGLPLQVLQPALLGLQLTLGLGLEGDGGGRRLPQRAQVLEHLPGGLLEHLDRDLRLGLADDGVEYGLEEARDAREHGTASLEKWREDNTRPSGAAIST